jgi:hypothetical protein
MAAIALEQRPSAESSEARFTRISALVDRVLGSG